jgi:hypothetical protein
MGFAETAKSRVREDVDVEDDIAGGYFGLDEAPGQRDIQHIQHPTLDTQYQTPDTRYPTRYPRSERNDAEILQ